MMVSKRNIIIADIDGTVADGSHRVHHVRGPRKNWAAYNELMHKDTVITPVNHIINALTLTGTHVVFVSGREGTVQNERATRTWLSENGVALRLNRREEVECLGPNEIELYMRAEKDYRGDDIVKEEIYRTHIEPKYNVIGVIDDRDKVCAMWIRLGVFLFNVSQGRGNF